MEIYAAFDDTLSRAHRQTFAIEQRNHNRLDTKPSNTRTNSRHITLPREHDARTGRTMRKVASCNYQSIADGRVCARPKHLKLIRWQKLCHSIIRMLEQSR